MSIGFSVIGGYLGAGKTTLLNHLLRNNDGLRIALLINDFGALNIDAELVVSQDERQINLTNGCVCCTLSDGFFEALERLQHLEPAPHQIVVEASGVADVATTAQYGHTGKLTLNAILVLADAETVRTKARDKYVATTVQRQLKAADLIVLNKADLVSAEALEETSAWLQSLAPTATVLPATQAQIPMELIFGPSQITLETGHYDHETYTAWHHQGGQFVDLQAIEGFVDKAINAGALRLKGFVATADQTYLVQAVGQRVTMEVQEIERPTWLVAIGIAKVFDQKLIDASASEVLVEAS